MNTTGIQPNSTFSKTIYDLGEIQVHPCTIEKDSITIN